MDNIKIRNIKKEDIPEVVNIQIDGWRAAYKGMIDDEYLENMNVENKIKMREKDYIETGFIVAEHDNKVVGFCRYTDNIEKTPETPKADCELRALYVKPELKHNGIGKKMFQYTVNEFKNIGKTKMVLWCLKDNVLARKFYEKMGGIIIKERLIHIGNKDYQEVAFEYNINL